jgi:UDP-N-acetylmuramate dehydrogenase
MALRIDPDVPLAPLTTLGIGGPARHFVRVAGVDELRQAVRWASDRHEPLLILGGGSNVLIADRGFDGLVVHLDLRGITLRSEDEHATVHVAAGEPWDDFVAMSEEKGWAGVECLSGIPGSTGATPIQNVGAYGQEVSETIATVEALDRTTGLVRTFTNAECRFAYRSSLFKNVERERWIVLGVTFRLKRGGAGSARYPELRQYLEERGQSAENLRDVREAVIAIRRRKGMVLDPADPDTRSDGSFFMNPIVPASDVPPIEMPRFPAGDGLVKLSAAWLIEHAGFAKGTVRGNVGLSSKHTLAVINRGGGTAAEVIALVEEIQKGVRDQFGVEIHPEPNFVGF